MTRSWLPICSMRASWKKDFEVLDLQHIPCAEMQWLTTCQLRPPLWLLFWMECWKEDCGSLQLG
jgi:hypothetical protein